MTNGNIPLVYISCTASPSHIHLHPMQGYALHFHFFSSMLWLCYSLFHLHYASILEAIHLIPLITTMTHPCSHRYRV